MEATRELQDAIGTADLCGLLSRAFGFPDEELTDALVNGDFANDALNCLEEVGVDGGDIALARESLAGFLQRNASDLFENLKKGYSLLYLAPGAKKPVWPYESAFMYVAEGKKGVPSLFRSSITLDAERLMREASVLPKNSRTEPVDSIWNELSYLSFLYGSLASSLYEGDGSMVSTWTERIDVFSEAHTHRWFKSFFERTIEKAPALSYGAEYANLAWIGVIASSAL